MEHHHHHHHDHGPDCTCGCQDHHEHHHHHEERIRVSVHDVSVAGSLSLTVSMEYAEGVRLFSRILSEISGKITAHGGIVGHIKALITDMSKSCMLSVTDEEEASVSEYTSPRILVEVACITMAMEPGELKHILHEHFEHYL